MSISYREQMIAIADKYRVAGQEWPATNRMVARWAVRQGLYELPENTTVDACAKDLSSAFGSATQRNQQGQTVRTMAAAPRLIVDDDGKPKQQWFWDHVNTASHEHMIAAFRARRRQARGDVRQLQSDIDDYNRNHLNNGHIEINMSFNFDQVDEDEVEAPAA